LNTSVRHGDSDTRRTVELTAVTYQGALQAVPTYERVPYIRCNGLWEYRPDFANQMWRRAAKVENVRSGPQGLTAEDGKTGTIVWTMTSPYVFVGGRIEVEGAGAKFFLSEDGKTWRPT